MARSSAQVLIVVLLLSSGRLLACGVECLGEVVPAAEASCHQDPAAATAMNGDGMHACLPDVPEPQVTAAKPAGPASIAAPVAIVVTGPHLGEPAWSPAAGRLRHLPASPALTPSLVLRI